MGISLVLNTTGWICLLGGWVIPQLKWVKDEANKSLIGIVLSAVSLGFFVSALVVSIMK